MTMLPEDKKKLEQPTWLIFVAHNAEMLQLYFDTYEKHGLLSMRMAFATEQLVEYTPEQLESYMELIQISLKRMEDDERQDEQERKKK